MLVHENIAVRPDTITSIFFFFMNLGLFLHDATGLCFTDVVSVGNISGKRQSPSIKTANVLNEAHAFGLRKSDVFGRAVHRWRQ